MPPVLGRELPPWARGEALSRLERLKTFLERLVDRFFEEREAARIKEYLRKRLDGAREILLHADARVASVRRLAENAYTLTMISSRAAGKPLLLAPRYTKTLEGGVRLVPPRAEEVYTVEVGPYALKCTCPDSIYTAARADQVLARLGFPPQAYKYTLCKHVLAGLALLWAMNLIDPTKPPLDEALLRALVTVYLATLPRGSKPRVSRIALVYTRGEGGAPLTAN